MEINKVIKYKVPDSFQFAPFYFKDSVFKEFAEIKNAEEMINIEPFYFDMLHQLNIELLHVPWNSPERYVPFVLEQWKKLNSIIISGYKNRNTNKSAIIHALSLLTICLFWSNGKPVKSLHVKNMRISELKYKPVNCEERLRFVFQKPTQYHSYVQLQQLFTELEKIFSTAQVVKNK